MGIGLGGPALRALKAIGVLDQCVECGFGYSYFNAADADGNITGTVQLPRLNGPDYPAAIGISRQALHSILQRALTDAQVPVRLGVTVATLDQDDGGVDVTCTDGRCDRYDLVVGADGASSKIRDILFGTQWRPTYTGQAVWRATVGRPLDVQSRTSYQGLRNKAGYNPVSDREMYIYLVQNLPDFVRLRTIGCLGSCASCWPTSVASSGRHAPRLPIRIHRLSADHVTDPVAAMVSRPRDPRRRRRSHHDAPHGGRRRHRDRGLLVLAELLQTEQTPAQALEAFMTRRFERCRMVVENSFQLGEWEKAPNTLAPTRSAWRV